MDIKKYKKYLFCAATVVVMLSCKNFSFSSYVKGDAIASVGDRELYLDDIKSIFVQGMNPQDSVKILNSYVDLWIKQQIKIKMAEGRFSENEADIKKMVEDYRNALLIHKYEEWYVASKIDTAISRNEAEEYYTANKNEFVLSAPMVKGLVVKVPYGFRQEGKIRELARAASTEALHSIVEISLKSELEYREFPEWTDFPAVAGFIPRMSEGDYRTVQLEGGTFEISENGYRYFLVINSLLKAGEPMPLDMASGTVKLMILNRRKQQLLKEMEESLYNDAMGRGEIKTSIIKEEN